MAYPFSCRSLKIQPQLSTIVDGLILFRASCCVLLGNIATNWGDWPETFPLQNCRAKWPVGIIRAMDDVILFLTSLTNDDDDDDDKIFFFNLLSFVIVDLFLKN